MLKLLNVVSLNLSIKIEEGCLIVRTNVLARIWLNFLKFRIFVSKKWLFLSPLALNLLEVDTFKMRPYSSDAQIRASCTPAGFKSLLEL